MKTPIILCRHIVNMAAGHSSLMYRFPYPIVCCVSTENRKHDIKPFMFVMQGFIGSDELSFNCSAMASRSPCVYEMSHQIRAKLVHDNMKLIENTINVQRHCASTSVVNRSCMYLLRRLATLPCTTLHSPFLKITRFLMRRAEYLVWRYLEEGIITISW